MDPLIISIFPSMDIGPGWVPQLCLLVNITPSKSKYSYLRIIHQLVIIVICTNLANELGPHPAITIIYNHTLIHRSIGLH